VLNGPCTHTGTTLVTGGTLVVNNTFTSAITVSAGATLAGNMTSSAAITATAAGARIAPGGSTGTLTASNINLATGGILEIEIDGAATPAHDKLVATGSLNISGATLDVTLVNGPAPSAVVIASYGTLTGTFGSLTGVPAGYEIVYQYNDGISSNNIALIATTDPYLTWLGGFPEITGSDRAPTADFDKDGLANAIEFVIGGDPTAPDSPALLPVSSVDDTYLNFVFRRTLASATFQPGVEYGSNLDDDWTLAVNGENGVVIQVDLAFYGPGVDRVTTRIPRALANGSKLFARLRVDIPFAP